MQQQQQHLEGTDRAATRCSPCWTGEKYNTTPTEEFLLTLLLINKQPTASHFYICQDLRGFNGWTIRSYSCSSSCPLTECRLSFFSPPPHTHSLDSSRLQIGHQFSLLQEKWWAAATERDVHSVTHRWITVAVDFNARLSAKHCSKRWRLMEPLVRAVNRHLRVTPWHFHPSPPPHPQYNHQSYHTCDYSGGAAGTYCKAAHPHVTILLRRGLLGESKNHVTHKRMGGK